MATSAWFVYSPFAKEHYGKGVADGKAGGKAAAVLTVLTARGLQLSDEQRRLIETTTDHDQLDDWLLTAESA
ncbi:hypothetical protein [Microbispora sp. NPDC049125]|uniref:hypothetical protein n=1 Tax=Microbispora sp. NPDC049125 TaxID=3154929 RepID=UPI0034659387